MATRLAICFLGVVLFLGWGGGRIYNGVDLKRNMTGYLKRAGDANTIALATKELEKAVIYLERRELTQGYTSILYRTPDEDISFWYQNLKAALGELKATSPAITPLEQSNMLMKLRETLMDNDANGLSVTVPDGLSVYPSNVLFAFWGFGSVLLAALGLFFAALYETY